MTVVLLACLAGVSLGWWLSDDDERGVETAVGATTPVAAPPAIDSNPTPADVGETARAKALRTLRENPRDSGALRALAELAVEDQQYHSAVGHLLTVLEYPDDLDVVDEVERRLLEVTGRWVAELQAAGDYAGIIDVFAGLTRSDPARDRWRLEHARWLGTAGDRTAAQEVLETVGLNGVEPQEIDALRAELAATAPLAVRRDGRRLLARSAISGRDVELLVDTGATRTGLNASVLAALPARPLPQRVRVMTAGGVIEARVFLVKDLQFGGRRFEEMAVIELEHEIGGADGILGMDVLEITGVPQ